MGIVADQSIKNLVTLFIGVFLGALNIIVLYPIVLSEEEFGLTRIILSLAIIAANFGTLGSPSIFLKFLPNVKGALNLQRKISRVVLKLSGFGMISFLLLLLLFKDNVLSYYTENSTLLVENYHLIYYLFFFISINALLSSYCRGIFKSVFQNVMNEIIIRLIQTVLLLMVLFDWIDFDFFMLGLVGSYGIVSVLLLIHLIRIKKLNTNSSVDVELEVNGKELRRYGIANFLTGLAGNLTGRIDALMIASLIGCAICSSNKGLEELAIYSWALYIAILIEIPSRALTSIGVPVISNAWQSNDLKTISSLYKSSSITQLVVGLFIFLGLWLNWDILMLVNNDYEEGKLVFLFLGISKLVHIGAGLNGSIINTSKYYYFSTIFMIFLAVFTFFTNLYFIPLYGIVGAAIATTISIITYNILAFLFLLIKYKMQPFTYRTVVVFVIAGFSFYVADIIDFTDILILNLILKSIVMTVIYGVLIFVLKISPDINQSISKFTKAIF